MSLWYLRFYVVTPPERSGFLQCRAKTVPSVLRYIKAMRIGLAPEINPTDQAYPHLQKNAMIVSFRIT